jgi:hypothetical protein
MNASREQNNMTIEQQSNASIDTSQRQIFNGSVNTTAIQEKTGVAAKQDSIQQSYGIPTIKLLNPELFKI